MATSSIVILAFLAILAIAPAGSVQVMFDSFSYCNGTGMIECPVRVRKVNRTTAALSGKIIQNVDIGGSFETSIELHHSPLGNNQFNRYPMKIGPINMCVFIENSWGDYYEKVVKYVPNIMKPKECPYTARVLEINDWILDAEMFPIYVPAGLWKMIHVIKDDENGHNSTMEVIFKVYEDGYF